MGAWLNGGLPIWCAGAEENNKIIIIIIIIII